MCREGAGRATGASWQRPSMQLLEDRDRVSVTRTNVTRFPKSGLSSCALSWDDPVQQYLPWFQLADPWVTREFTIRDLVTHRSGLGLGAGDLVWFHSDYPREEVVRRLRYAKPVTSFRTAYAYDNVLY